MKTQQINLFENRQLLMEIGNLKTKKNEIYEQKGPGNSDYIMLSIKLDFLMNKYIEEKIKYLK